MRNPPESPSPRTRRVSDRGRAFVIVGAVVVVGLLLSVRLLSSFYVDYLWHQSVGRTDVFWGMLGAKATMFGMFAVAFIAIAFLNLVIADRLAPVAFSANTHPLVERFHEFFGHRLRMVRFAVTGVFGLMFAAPAISEWQNWLMFRNSKSFGISDAQFGNDVGFYMFKLPFVTFVLSWLYLAVGFITVIVIGTHVLSGGIVLQPPRPKVRKATKAHVAVLLGIMALLKAGDYWLTRYELSTSNRGSFTGPNYTVVNAQLPGLVLLGLIAVFTAALFLSTLKTDNWRPAVIASALWALMALVGGVIYPAAVQSLVVNPNKKDKEATFIAHNITATRHALGIDQVEVQKVSFNPITAAKVQDNVAALQDVRYVKPDALMESRFRNDRGKPGQSINNLHPDRYMVDGTLRQVIVGAPELDLSQVGNKSWQGTHLINTHGCGLAMAPSNQIKPNGDIVYRDDIAKITRPELYFSPSLSGYAIVDSKVNEQPCDGQAIEQYKGTAGVQLNSGVRKLAFALNEFDYNLFGSSAITRDARLLGVRNVRDRVATIAPFLSLDGDPYPAVLNGRVLWVIDAYTTSNRYPYGQFADLSQLLPNSGLNHSFNYVRNSVKATVDAYDGTIHLYTMDDTDPVLQVWKSTFPQLFEPKSAMPAGLADHLKYPEDLFRVQTAAYSKYRLDATDFFDRNGAWSVALAAPEIGATGITSQSNTVNTAGTGASGQSGTAQTSDFAVESTAARFEPYYTMFHPKGTNVATFELYRPFQPFSTTDQRKELVAYMTASSDPETLGKLTAYVVTPDPAAVGPFTVGSAMVADPNVSKDVTIFNQQGSRVNFGDLQMLPLADGVMWVRPMYVQSESSGLPQVKRIIVNYRGVVGLGSSLEEALAAIFPGFNTTIGDVAGTVTTDPGGPKPPITNATANELLAQAEQLFADADAALKKGDLGTYAAKVNAARDLVQQAIDLIDQQSSTAGSGTTVPSSGTTGSTTTVPSSGTTAPTATTKP
ncbi:MAG: UPF0182 family protein [Actinomycetota bacterium]